MDLRTKVSDAVKVLRSATSVLRELEGDQTSVVKDYTTLADVFEKTENVRFLYTNLYRIKEMYHLDLNTKYAGLDSYQEQFLKPVQNLRVNVMALALCS